MIVIELTKGVKEVFTRKHFFSLRLQVFFITSSETPYTLMKNIQGGKWMERTTWHFPKPLHEKKKLNKQEEQQLFHRLAEDFSAILDRGVIINNHRPIRFDDKLTPSIIGRKDLNLLFL